MDVRDLALRLLGFDTVVILGNTLFGFNTVLKI